MSNGLPKKLFKIVENEQKGAFNDEATGLIVDGYEPVGGIFVYLKDSKSFYAQAFWRPEAVERFRGIT